MDQADVILEQLAGQTCVPEEQLKQLPRWALVALAVRGARRAQPLFLTDWPDAPEEFQQTIENALALTEASAANGTEHPDLKEAASQAGKTATTAANLTARFASFTVTFAAVNAAHVATAENTDNAVAFVQAATDSCHKSATFASAKSALFKSLQQGTVATALRQALQRDFDTLLERARTKAWTTTTPVDMASLGPLWPDGAPRGFPGPRASTFAR